MALLISVAPAETIAVENAKLEKALRLAGITSVTSLLGMQVSVGALGGAAAAAAAGIPVVGVAVGLVLAVTGVGVTYMKALSDARRDTPSSYLLDIRKHVRLAGP